MCNTSTRGRIGFAGCDKARMCRGLRRLRRCRTRAQSQAPRPAVRPCSKRSRPATLDRYSRCRPARGPGPLRLKPAENILAFRHPSPAAPGVTRRSSPRAELIHCGQCAPTASALACRRGAAVRHPCLAASGHANENGFSTGARVGAAAHAMRSRPSRFARYIALSARSIASSMPSPTGDSGHPGGKRDRARCARMPQGRLRRPHAHPFQHYPRCVDVGAR